MRVVFVAISLAFASSASAECPPAPDIAADQARILKDIQSAKNDREAHLITGELWALWTRAPDEWSQNMLDRGMEARRIYDFLTALKELNKLVDYCPDFAEGYNQRAFVRFLSKDYEAALSDLDVVLKINPTHVPAMSGKALTLMGLGREDEAQTVLREALELNPWIPERNLLREPPGEDL